LVPLRYNAGMKHLLKRFGLLCCLAVLAHAQTRSVVLTWTASASGAERYNIFRLAIPCPAGGAQPTWSVTPLLTTALSATTATDATALIGTTYCYAGTALDAFGNQSVFSNTSQAVVTPYAPSLTSTQGAGSVVLTIVEPAAPTLNPPGVTHNIYRATGLCSGSPVFSKIATGLSVATFTDSTVTGGPYCYQGTDTFNGLEGSAGAAITVTVPPAPPTNFGNTVP
jgi:hypothetical protein